MSDALPIVRKASPADVDAIFSLVELYTANGIVLRRSKEDILQHIGNFYVATLQNEPCACCAVRDFGNELLEVRSLVVDPAFQGRGIGKVMLKKIIADLLAQRENWRLFTLTLQVEFFRKLGFKEVNKELFPEKIWSDCSKCPKFNCCDETALLLTSSDIRNS